MFTSQLIENNFIPDCINPFTWFSSEKTEEEVKAQDKIKKIAEQFGINKEISVTIDNSQCGSILGNNLFPGSASIILSNEYDEKTTDFITKHEMTHLKNSDTITIPVVEWVSATVGYVGISYLFPTINPFFYLVAAISIDLVTASTFSKWREEIADKTALEYCDEETKQKALEFFEDSIKQCIKKRNEFSKGTDLFSTEGLCNLLNKMKYSEDGNNRYDLVHPSNTERCRYIKEIIKKNTPVTP